MFDKVKEMLMNHRMEVVTVGRSGSGTTWRCRCGAPFLREEQWARHVAELIVLETLETADKK